MPPARSKELKLLHSWQGEFLLLIIFALLSYWFVSAAIDSGRTLEYGAAIIFGILALKNLARLIKHLIGR
ncbi:TPA: hypothetical protein DIS56_00885 [Candidatus Saccharibacteria bacterium]|nr:MAG: hypothetical protein A3F05_03175 [Candidatus Saccharibacteria bacterium RIFCSPHIGHO2_12_FULL_47_17]HCM51678.1 hypothetical protein [Candidatus Saccharibacteria bacterium]